MYLPVLLEHKNECLSGKSAFTCYNSSDIMLFFLNDLLKQKLINVLPLYLIFPENQLYSEVKSHYKVFQCGPSGDELYDFIHHFQLNKKLYNKIKEHFEKILALEKDSQNKFLTQNELNQIITSHPFIRKIHTAEQCSNIFLNLEAHHEDLFYVMELYENGERNNELLQCIRKAVSHDIMTFKDLYDFINFSLTLNKQDAERMQTELAYLFYKSNENLCVSFFTQVKEVLNKYAIRRDDN